MKKPNSHSFREKAGMALVVTLSLIVLVSAVVLAFFARATANRSIETSRANFIEARQLAQSANDYVVAQFLSEISLGTNSNIKSVNGVSIYQPKTAVNAIPQRALMSSWMLGDSTLNNLVRQSAPTADTNVSSHPTFTPSKNNRYISASRWSSPRLTTSDLATSQTPNWIYVNKDGSTSKSPNENTIGRFAYNVYDIGGLLDVNVMGYPTAINNDIPAVNFLKSSIAGADPTSLKLNGSPIDNFINFRNPTAGLTYTTLVAQAATNAFVECSTYNYITSRQDLIRYAKVKSTNFVAALPYLTHFSYHNNAPSWGPALPQSPNFFVLDIRDSSGKPLIKSRFPLNRLAAIGDNGVDASSTAAEVQKNFGLAWQNSRWEYVGASGSVIQNKIKTLDEVATDKREPNFFEVLKAAILSGSLGQSGTGTAWDTSAEDSDRDLHIMRIGANIIDQFDANSKPTQIAFNSTSTGTTVEVQGIESIPYINKLTISESGGDLFLNVELWNPHYGASDQDVELSLITQPSGTVNIDGQAVTLNTIASPVKSTTGAFSTSQSLVKFKLGSASVSTNVSPHQLNVVSGGHLGSYQLKVNGIVAQKIANITLNNTTQPLPIVLRRADPRGTRLGGSLENSTGNDALLPSTVTTGKITDLQQNQTGAHYADNDGVIRPADNFKNVGAFPEFLNRPFRTVGELSYVFRDLPWKSLDFSTKDSADAALLDFFCVNDSSNPVVAGKVSANTHQPVVIQSLLSRGDRKVTTGTSALSSSDASFPAINYYSEIANTPLLTPAEIATRYAPQWSGPKTEREVAVRALGEVAQTRTWNLLADVIAQVGRFPSKSYGAGDFVVEAEQRAWTSFAVDRYTAKILVRQTESVSE